MPLDQKSYAAGNFLFRLDNNGDEGAAYLKSVAGGMVRGAVLEEQAGPAAVQFKHLGAVEIEPIQLEIGMAMSKPLLDWIAGSWQKKFTRQNGCILHADFNLKCKTEQWFEDALIAETKFPTLDGAAKEPAYLGVTLNPERVKLLPGKGEPVQGVVGKNQKLWSPSNFRLSIDGADCSHVNRVDSFTVTQRIRPLYTGVDRFPELEPTGIDFSNIIVYLAVAHARDFENWYDEFIVQGGKDTKMERQGSLEFLHPDNKTTLFTVYLNRLGIHRMSVEKSEANTEQMKRYKIELYLEDMELEYERRFLR